jgi:hypothetical protein
LPACRHKTRSGCSVDVCGPTSQVVMQHHSAAGCRAPGRSPRLTHAAGPRRNWHYGPAGCQRNDAGTTSTSPAVSVSCLWSSCRGPGAPVADARDAAAAAWLPLPLVLFPARRAVATACRIAWLPVSLVRRHTIRNGAGNPVTGLRRSSLAHQADFRIPGQRASSRMRPPSQYF